MAINKVVVLGGGTMGLDIAQVFVKAGKEVYVRDISDEIIARSKARLEKGLDKLIAKGRATAEDKAFMLEKLGFTTDIAIAADADLVVEAIVEKMNVKKAVFGELESICQPSTIFASNTSTISITEMASATKRPGQFIGMHFFNPATVMKLIEVTRGANTSQETYDTIFSLSKEIGKDPVTVNEAPGFIVNKILVPMINEAVGLVETGVASVEDIDKAMMLGSNHPMGPLTLGDFIGLDVCLDIMDILYAETQDPKYRASLLLRKMIRGGLLGRKSGKGFYDYTKK